MRSSSVPCTGCSVATSMRLSAILGPSRRSSQHRSVTIHTHAHYTPGIGFGNGDDMSSALRRARRSLSPSDRVSRDPSSVNMACQCLQPRRRSRRNVPLLRRRSASPDLGLVLGRGTPASACARVFHRVADRPSQDRHALRGASACSPREGHSSRGCEPGRTCLPFRKIIPPVLQISSGLTYL
jgi:hypothetical protein